MVRFINAKRAMFFSALIYKNYMFPDQRSSTRDFPRSKPIWKRNAVQAHALQHDSGTIFAFCTSAKSYSFTDKVKVLNLTSMLSKAIFFLSSRTFYR